MFSWQFGSIEWLLALLLFPLFYLIRKRFNKKQNNENLLFAPSIQAFGRGKSIKAKIYPLLNYLRYLALAILIIALARPRKVETLVEPNHAEGIDIIMAIDVSLSMLAQDLKPDRITALKKVAQEFVSNRTYDRIGLLVYSGEAITKVPLTIDKTILLSAFENIKTKELQGGTAIGVGLATAINHLKNSKTKSKIIILMTDGVNNDGFIDPKTATKIAKDKNIKVYTIGIGTNGMAMFPVIESLTGEIMFDYKQVEIDQDLLKFIATETGGKYYRAQDEEALDKIYNEINQLEKSKIQEKVHYNYTEYYQSFLLTVLVLLCVEFLLRKTLLRTFI
jgi:Ca-activated chloride channel homolog